MSEDLVSVIIPTFRRPRDLEKAIASVINQSYKNIEIIVVDDDTAGNYEGTQLNNLKYFKNERTKGGNGARNTGILHASGNYIAFLDDDDEWLPSKIELQLNKLKSVDDKLFGACYCGWITDGVAYVNGADDNTLEGYLEKDVPIGASSTLLFKKEAIIKIGLWDENLIRHQDLDLMIRLLMFYNISFVAEALVIVNGHNVPFYKKSVQAKHLYLDKLKSLSQNLPKKQYDKYVALQYRELALLASFEGLFKEVTVNLWHAYRSAYVPIKKLLPIGVYFINYYTIRAKFGKFKRHLTNVYSKHKP